jgi:L-arabinonolactonase
MSALICAVERTHSLGEGPIWDAARGRLWWVDINGRRLEWFEPASGADGGVDLEVQTTSVVPRANGVGLLAAAKPGLGVLDPETGAFELKIELEADRPHNRPNDGNVDLAGRYWFGTMHETYGRFEGSLYRLDPDWTLTRCITGMGIPNTLVCSADGRRLYIADSTRLTLETASIDPETGALGPTLPFADTKGQSYGPDGSAVDAEGYLWNCQWGGSRIVRYAPDGRIDRIVPLPVTNPTSCAFGGADLDTLYITSARETLSPETLAREPWSGALMAFKPGVRGLDLPPFGG